MIAMLSIVRMSKYVGYSCLCFCMKKFKQMWRAILTGLGPPQHLHSDPTSASKVAEDVADLTALYFFIHTPQKLLKEIVNP